MCMSNRSVLNTLLGTLGNVTKKHAYYIYDWLYHWLLVIDSISSPSSFPGDQGRWDWKFQLSNHRLSSAGNQPSSLGVFQESSHSHNKRHLYALIKEISRVLGAQCQKWRQRQNNIFLTNLLSYYATPLFSRITLLCIIQIWETEVSPLMKTSSLCNLHYT